MQKNNRQIEIENRLTKLEGGLIRIESKLSEITDNHIAHLDSKMWWGITLAITVLVGLVINLGLIITKGYN